MKDIRHVVAAAAANGVNEILYIGYVDIAVFVVLFLFSVVAARF